jgi:lipopolysaccharide/colanic/teichoic acid biosynthesis glycosyltransferase
VRSDGDPRRPTKRLDTYYIRNWSVWFDLYLLGRTIAAVAAVAAPM